MLILSDLPATIKLHPAEEEYCFFRYCLTNPGELFSGEQVTIKFSQSHIFAVLQYAFLLFLVMKFLIFNIFTGR